MAIVDFLAILPFFLPVFGLDMRMLRILRLFRLIRLFKIARYVKAIGLIADVFKQKKEELILSLVFTFFLLLLTSSVMYYVENNAQPDSFASIPQTMWWGISTLTTVGYGDVYPVTTLGKFFGGIISVLGIGLFALPTGILASGFASALEKSNVTDKNDGNFCPHCGADKSELS